jgi:putative transposase
VAQSLSRILLHIIFSTKNRFPFLNDTHTRNRMHRDLSSVRNQNDTPVVEVGGTGDHVHILCLLSRKHAVSELVRKANANSSAWAKSLGGKWAKFSWQSGYGVFSVDRSQMDPLRRYIQDQSEHHRHKTFQEEYVEFLRGNNVECDERHLWEWIAASWCRPFRAYRALCLFPGLTPWALLFRAFSAFLCSVSQIPR